MQSFSLFTYIYAKNFKAMKKPMLTLTALVVSFALGVAFKSVTTSTSKEKMKRVTGIGGIFFKCKDPKKMTAWYQQHLGLETNPYGATFEWYEGADRTKRGQTQWTPFPQETKYFEPSAQQFMINYRVENLEALVEELKKEGVTIVDQIAVYDYGKFVHILDAEDNKVELWEAADQ